MACIKCLPVELIFIVASFLDPADVKKLALVAKVYLGIVRPLIYADTMNVFSNHPDGDFALFVNFAKNPAHRAIGARLRHLTLGASDFFVETDEKCNPIAPVLHAHDLPAVFKFCPNLVSVVLNDIRFFGGRVGRLAPLVNLRKLTLARIVVEDTGADPSILFTLQAKWEYVEIIDCRWHSFGVHLPPLRPPTSTSQLQLSFPLSHTLCSQFLVYLPVFVDVVELRVDWMCARSAVCLEELIAATKDTLESITLEVHCLRTVGRISNWDFRPLRKASSAKYFTLLLSPDAVISDRRDRATLLSTIVSYLPPSIEDLSVGLSIETYQNPADQHDLLVDWERWAATLRTYNSLRYMYLWLQPIVWAEYPAEWNTWTVTLLQHALEPQSFVIEEIDDGMEALAITLR